MSLNPDEEARALAFRQQAARRIRNTRARAIALGGDRAARVALLATWEPVRVWLTERRVSSAPGAPGGIDNWPDRPHDRGPHRGSDAGD